MNKSNDFAIVGGQNCSSFDPESFRDGLCVGSLRLTQGKCGGLQMCRDLHGLLVHFHYLLSNGFLETKVSAYV